MPLCRLVASLAAEINVAHAAANRPVLGAIVHKVRLPDGKLVHKGAVVSGLSEGTKISTDRVKRYQDLGKVKTTPRLNLAEDEWTAGLFDDVALRFEMHNPTASKKVAIKWDVFAARIMRMRRKLPSGRFIDYKEKLTFPWKMGDPDVYLRCYFYTRQRAGVQFKYNSPDPDQYHYAVVCGPVDIRFDSHKNIFVMAKQSLHMMQVAASGAKTWASK